MYIIFKSVFIIGLLFISTVSDIKAYNQLSSASNSNLYRPITDYRALKLKIFLKHYDSPLEGYAYEFISCADKNNIDWRLLPAITGVESTFGKHIPYNSYNAYGWANGKYYFNSWEGSINTVCEALKKKYYDRGLMDVNSISKVYAPPSSTWAFKVNYFMNKIEQYPLDFTL